MEDWIGNGAVGLIAFILGKYIDTFLKRKDSFRQDFIELKNSYKEEQAENRNDIKDLRERVKSAESAEVECNKKYNELKDLILSIAPMLEEEARKNIFKKFGE